MQGLEVRGSGTGYVFVLHGAQSTVQRCNSLDSRRSNGELIVSACMGED